jgi:polysaccharide biosynthesis protein PslE
MNEVGLSVRDTLNAFYKKIILFWITCIAIVLAVLAACLTLPPVYESTAKIIITSKKESSALMQVPSNMAASAMVNLNVDERDLNSEMGLLQSIDLWTRVVKKIGLPALEKTDKGAIASFFDGIVNAIPALSGSSKVVTSNSKGSPEVVAMAGTLIKKLKVFPAPKSKIIDLSFKYDQPAMAEKILSTLLAEYIPYHLQVYSLPGAQGFYSGQGELYKERLDKAENALTDFNKKFGISIIGTQKEQLISSIKQIDDSLVDVNSSLRQFENMLADLERNHVPTGQLMPSAQLYSENTVISVIATQLLRAKQKQLLAQLHFMPSSREYTEADDLVRELTNKFKNSLEAEVGELKAKKASLEKSRKENQAALQLLVDKTESLKRLQLAASIAKKRYMQYIAKEEEARVALKGGAKLLNVSIAASPVTPMQPVFPKTGLMVLGAFLLSIPLGIGVVLVANFLDHTFDNPSELQAATNIPVLASFTKLNGAEAQKRR